MTAMIDEINGPNLVLHIMWPMNVTSTMFALSMQNNQRAMGQLGRHVFWSKQMTKNLHLVIRTLETLKLDNPVALLLRKTTRTLRHLRLLALQLGSIGEYGSKLTG